MATTRARVKRSLPDTAGSSNGSPPKRKKTSPVKTRSVSKRRNVQQTLRAQTAPTSSQVLTVRETSPEVTRSLRSYNSSAVVPALPREVTVDQGFRSLNPIHRNSYSDTNSVASDNYDQDESRNGGCVEASSESMDSLNLARLPDGDMSDATEEAASEHMTPPRPSIASMPSPRPSLEQDHGNTCNVCKIFWFLARIVWFVAYCVGISIVGAMGAHLLMIGMHGPEWYNFHQSLRNAQLEIVRLRGDFRNCEMIANESRRDFEQVTITLRNDLSQQQQVARECSRQLEKQEWEISLLQNELAKQKDISIGCHDRMEEATQEILGLRDDLSHQQAVINECHNNLQDARHENSILQEKLHHQQEAAVEALNVIGTMSAVRFQKAERQVGELQSELSRQQEAAINAINFVALAVANQPEEEQDAEE